MRFVNELLKIVFSFEFFVFSDLFFPFQRLNLFPAVVPYSSYRDPRFFRFLLHKLNQFFPILPSSAAYSAGLGARQRSDLYPNPSCEFPFPCHSRHSCPTELSRAASVRERKWRRFLSKKPWSRNNQPLCSQPRPESPDRCANRPGRTWNAQRPFPVAVF